MTRPLQIFSAALLCALVVIAACRRVSEDPPPELTDAQRCSLYSSEADAALAAGAPEAACSLLVEAALLADSGSRLRGGLVARADSLARPPAPMLAVLLLEGPPDSSTALRALFLGGAFVAGEVTAGLQRGRWPLPEYVALLAADSLVSAGRYAAALDLLRGVPDTLPKAADSRRRLLLAASHLNAGSADTAGALLARALDEDEDELASAILNARALWLRRRGVRGWRDDLVRSFRLWPAGDMHAEAFRLMLPDLLEDSSLASSVADPFYSGGLWNELYQMARLAENPPAHLYYLAARTRDRLGFYGQAEGMLERYLETWPDGEDAPLALIYLGLDRARMGETDAGLACFDLFESRHPGNRRMGNLPWYRGSVLADAERWEESIPHFRRTLQRYPDNVTADDAHLYLCLALMETERFGEAVEELERFTRRWNRSVYLDAARYWLGRLRLETGLPGGREELEGLVSDSPHSLPASYARRLMGLPAWRPEHTDEPLEDWMSRNGLEPAGPPPAALRGRALVDAGLRSWGVAEMRRAEDVLGSPAPLGPFYLAGGIWERMPSAAWRMWSLADDGTRPLELWKLRYPEAWPHIVVPVCRRWGFDPLLAWAIMKQESAFQPACYSTAGARGLIQMIPSTSEYVARENGWGNYSPDRLYRPEVSLEYGISYLSGVAADLGHLHFTLAGYNGGPHNAARWGAGKVSPAMFFSRITFNETKRYTEIVAHNYDVYRAIYPHRSLEMACCPDWSRAF
ncbi:MAG: transglycosylase SLT domain-containing protein [Candidatus Fermentibacteraceae bacterium]